MIRCIVQPGDHALDVGLKPLGAGGQGEVYEAKRDGKPYALKLYHTHTATAQQRQAIERLIQKGTPSPSFLWPLHLVEARDARRFGYLMDLREARFRPTEDLMARRVTTSFRALVRAALHLSDGFLQLHARGLCYRDISFGNVFLDPATGDVRICDNDNVDVSGAAPSGVLGTPRFMAPEVVRGEAPPSKETDRYSLAVLLFYLLMGGHPLEGAKEAQIRCLDLPAMNKLYGHEPVYVFDPADGSNRPVPGIHDNPLVFKSIYPRFLLDAFEASFTDGLRYPGRRIMESQWRKLFARVLDLVMSCPSCRMQNFFDIDAPSAPCWKCRRPLSKPLMLRASEGPIVLQPQVKLHAHHAGDSFNYDETVAEVTEHPSRPLVLGLKNLSGTSWTVTRPDGSVVDVPPGKNAPLVQGNQIHFGQVTAEVEG
jgi:eukaryotic-like serine/threonine-protein kinase